jgi:hypothetical protein
LSPAVTELTVHRISEQPRVSRIMVEHTEEKALLAKLQHEVDRLRLITALGGTTTALQFSQAKSSKR